LLLSEPGTALTRIISVRPDDFEDFPMETHDSTANPPSAQGEPNSTLPSNATSTKVGWSGRPSTALRLWALGAGLGAALLSWLLIEATFDSFKPKGLTTQHGAQTFLIPDAAERDRAVSRNAALAMGLSGAAVGLVYGLAGAASRRAARAAALWAIAGLVLGAAVAAGTALAAVPLASRLQQRDPGNSSIEMACSLLVHGLPWAAMGTVAGLVFGIGQGDGRQASRGLLGGVMGGIAGAFLYEIIGELALPGSKLIEPVAATWQARLLAQALAVMSVAVGLAALCGRPSARKV
jgi:hypothetical protein